MGHNLMQQLEMDASFLRNVVEWKDITVPFVPQGHWTRDQIKQLCGSLYKKEDPSKSVSFSVEPSVLGEEVKEVFLMGSTKAVFKKVVYEPTDLLDLVSKMDYLDTAQKSALLATLAEFPEIFEGKKGDWKGEEIFICLKECSKPYYAKAYLIPLSQQEAYEVEVERQCSIGSLCKLTAKEVELGNWAFPTFGVPKKNGQIRIVADLRKVNNMIERSEFHIPVIEDTLIGIQGFSFATKINLNIGYQALHLDNYAKSILQIIFPFGVYEYQVLPMGVKPATDLFQSRIVQLFAQMKKEERPMCYIDDILHVTCGSFEEHLRILKIILRLLSEVGMQVNAKKSEWCKNEIAYLGFTITPTRYKPMKS